MGAVRLNTDNQRFHLNANEHPADNHNRSRGMALAGRDSMKTYKRLYSKLCTYTNLESAFRKAKKRKSTRPYVIEFEKDLKENLFQLQNELQNETYRPQPLKTFILRDPKTRKISVSSFRDRIVHHALIQIIGPIFEKSFIYDSYANRVGKGTSAALRRFVFFKRKATHNGQKLPYTLNCNHVCGYALKADIKHYFETVNHTVLIEIISKKIKDEKIISLIEKILSNYTTKEQRKGMPLGNWTSQFFANIYLDRLDYFVKHQLQAEYYLRYVDDFIILHKDRKILGRYQEKIDFFLKERLKLELHPDKSKILSLAKAIPFLGYREFYHCRLLRKRNLRTVKSLMIKLQEEYSSEKINKKELKEIIFGWVGYLREADTYNLRNNLFRPFKDLNLTL